jgi:hypothetical protein
MADTKPQIPDYIAKRYSAWQGLWRFATQEYYLIGILSVVCSSIAATGQGGPGTSQGFAAAAAILTAAMGFLQPRRNYLKFVKAWRILDLAIMRFKAGLADESDLIDAVAAGEALLTRIEDEAADHTNPAPVDHSSAAAATARHSDTGAQPDQGKPDPDGPEGKVRNEPMT